MKRRGIKLMNTVPGRQPIEALQVFLRECNTEEKADVAKLAGTTVNNLHQIAGGHTGCSPVMAVIIEGATIAVTRYVGNTPRWVSRHKLTDWFNDNRELLRILEARSSTRLRLFVA